MTTWVEYLKPGTWNLEPGTHSQAVLLDRVFEQFPPRCGGPETVSGQTNDEDRGKLGRLGMPGHEIGRCSQISLIDHKQDDQ